MNPEDTAFIASQFVRCRPFLQAALDRDLGTHDLDDVWGLIRSGVAQLWPTPNAAMVTVIETFPKRKMLRGWLSGGALDEIQREEPRIRGWAQRQGCDLICIGGRRGWLRAFEGYEEASTVMVRYL